MPGISELAIPWKQPRAEHHTSHKCSSISCQMYGQRYALEDIGIYSQFPTKCIRVPLKWHTATNFWPPYSYRQPSKRIMRSCTELYGNVQCAPGTASKLFQMKVAASQCKNKWKIVVICVDPFEYCCPNKRFKLYKSFFFLFLFFVCISVIVSWLPFSFNHKVAIGS